MHPPVSEVDNRTPPGTLCVPPVSKDGVFDGVFLGGHIVSTTELPRQAAVFLGGHGGCNAANLYRENSTFIITITRCVVLASRGARTKLRGRQIRQR